ncbi:MAG: VOC family protein [Gemmatimonadales bacterium]|nr:VOC family protein [Gemmatimonadales bacterium]
MELGAFSISLAVRDLPVSQAFYEKLGFTLFGGEPANGWAIMKAGTTVVGLFHGMFEGNILTFNPGWDSDAQPVSVFTDVRSIQQRLRADGIALLTAADEGTAGPASITLEDPDGNVILIDQHI